MKSWEHITERLRKADRKEVRWSGQDIRNITCSAQKRFKVIEGLLPYAQDAGYKLKRIGDTYIFEPEREEITKLRKEIKRLEEAASCE